MGGLGKNTMSHLAAQGTGTRGDTNEQPQVPIPSAIIAGTVRLWGLEEQLLVTP